MRLHRQSWFVATVIGSLAITIALAVWFMLTAHFGPSPDEVERLKRQQIMRELLFIAWEYERDQPGNWPIGEAWRTLLETIPASYSLDKFGPVYFLRPARRLPTSEWEKIPAFFEDPSENASSTAVLYWDGTFERLSSREFERLIPIDQSERIE
tara:strand:+ start:8167 stop:8628 length:462 start_codon:yes stop_codon:yes gene_type:complete